MLPTSSQAKGLSCPDLQDRIVLQFMSHLDYSNVPNLGKKPLIGGKEGVQAREQHEYQSQNIS